MLYLRPKQLSDWSRHAGNLSFLRHRYQDVLQTQGHEPSHIHALYGEYVGEFNIQTFEMIEGDLPVKAQKMVQEWLGLYADQLQAMWDSQVIEKLPPLE